MLKNRLSYRNIHADYQQIAIYWCAVYFEKTKYILQKYLTLARVCVNGKFRKYYIIRPLCLLSRNILSCKTQSTLKPQCVILFFIPPLTNTFKKLFTYSTTQKKLPTSYTKFHLSYFNPFINMFKVKPIKWSKHLKKRPWHWKKNVFIYYFPYLFDDVITYSTC